MPHGLTILPCSHLQNELFRNLLKAFIHCTNADLLALILDKTTWEHRLLILRLHPFKHEVSL